jgi:uncharacterized protein (TIGR03067 family)
VGEWWQHLPAEHDGRTPAERDLAALQGVWAQVWSNGDGSVLEEPHGYPVRVTISGDRFTLSNWKVGGGVAFRIRIIPGQSPNAYDLVAEDDPSEVVEAIYELDGDTLRVCQPFAGKPRPREFNGDAGTMNLLIVHRRIG